MKVDNKSWFRKHKILTVILVLLILGFIGELGATKKQADISLGKESKSDTPSQNTQTTTTKSEAPKMPKVGEPVRDGKFEFVVNKISCGETSVGSQYAKYDAQGQFCRLNISVKNIGNEAQTLSYSEQFTYSADGKKFSANSSAAIYASSSTSSSTWYNDINPGNTVTGDIFFDVPKGMTPVTAELHDSALSSGVKVSLQ